MALDLAAIRPIPLVAGTVVTMILGAAWYGVFAKPWMAMAHPGRTQEELQRGPKWLYGLAAVAALAMSYVFGLIVQAIPGNDLATGIRLAALLSIVLLLIYVTTYSFSYKPAKLAAIDAGYYVVSLFALALLYAYL